MLLASLPAAGLCVLVCLPICCVFLQADFLFSFFGGAFE